MLVAWETRHVRSYLRHDHLSHVFTDSRNRLKQACGFINKRVAVLLGLLTYLCAHSGDRRFNLFELVEQLGQHESLRTSELASQRATQLTLLLSKRSAGKVRHLRCVLFASCKCSQHRAAAHAERTTCNLSKLDVRRLDQLDDLIGHRGLISHQSVSMPS